MTRMTKVVCVVHGPTPATTPTVAGLTAYALHRPAPAQPAEHPPDVDAIAMAWLEPGVPCDPEAWFPNSPIDAYVVDERVQIDYARDWPDGHASPGVKRVSFVRRAPGITRAAMATHWSEVHLPLARVHHPALWRYVQNVVVDTVTPRAPDCDGIAELHFHSVHDLRERFYDSDAGRAVIGEDVTSFLDRTKGWRMLTEETWLIGPAA
jgi:uncharacterized protein (TIGR02118 family)